MGSWCVLEDMGRALAGVLDTWAPNISKGTRAHSDTDSHAAPVTC